MSASPSGAGPHPLEPLAPANRLIATAYLAIALPLMCALAICQAPFASPDELAHMQRADQVASGALLSSRRVLAGELVAGGPTDPALVAAFAPLQPMLGHPERLLSNADLSDAARPRLGSLRAWTPAPGPAAYPPTVYGPAALALIAGRSASRSALDALLMARLLNALLCATLGYVALRFASWTALPLYSVLTLPMSAALGSGLSPDGMMLGLIAVGVAALSRAPGAGRHTTTGEFLAALGCFAVTAHYKAPYGLLGLVLVVAPGVAGGRRVAVVAAMGAAIAVSLWLSTSVATPLVRPGVTVDRARQALDLLEHPGRIAPLLAETLRLQWRQYVMQFLGYLGALDTLLPRRVYVLASLGLTAAWASVAPTIRAGPWRPLRTAAIVAIVSATAGVFAALYLSFNQVGGPWIEGVQGRYFLPMALLGALICSGPSPSSAGLPGRLRRVFVALALACPLLTLPLTLQAVVDQHYGTAGWRRAASAWPMLGTLQNGRPAAASLADRTGAAATARASQPAGSPQLGLQAGLHGRTCVPTLERFGHAIARR